MALSSNFGTLSHDPLVVTNQVQGLFQSAALTRIDGIQEGLSHNPLLLLLAILSPIGEILADLGEEALLLSLVFSLVFVLLYFATRMSGVTVFVGEMKLVCSIRGNASSEAIGYAKSLQQAQLQALHKASAQSDSFV